MANEYLFMLGTSSADSDMVNIESLDNGKMLAPQARHYDYRDTITLADNSEKGVGYPWCEWTWGNISFAQRSILKAYCAGASAQVYMQTQTNTADSDSMESWQRFRAEMVWQKDEGAIRELTGARVELRIEFRKLVAV